MKKQTAVEWLYEELWKQTDFSLPNNILEQAKELEKQQIMKAHMDGALNTIWDENTDRDENASDYYYETYYKKI
jgi:hypothetical protein